MTALRPATLGRITKILAIYLPLAGIFQTFLPLIWNNGAHPGGAGYRALQALFPVVNLRLLQFDFFVHIDDARSLSFDLAELVFFVFFLFASLLYFLRKESRLLQFCLALTFFGYASACLYITLGFVAFAGQYTVVLLLVSLLQLLACLAGAWLLWQVLRWLREPLGLATMVDLSGPEPETRLVPASRWQRWAHTLVDQTLCLLLLTPLVYWTLLLTRSDRGSFRMTADEWSFYLLFALMMLLYYGFFEALLGITPAKLLTGTRVTDEYGNRPRFADVVRRSLSRLVPFDGLSFLGNRGWHDEWSQTYVLREERRGLPVRMNLFLLPFLALLAYGCYSGMKAYSDHNEYRAVREAYTGEQAALARRFGRLKPGGILELKKHDGYSELTTFLVLHARESGDMVCEKVQSRGSYSSGGDLAQMKADRASSGGSGRLKIREAVLQNSFARSYDDRYKGIRLFDEEGEYSVVGIYAPGGPELRPEQSGSISGDEDRKTVTITLRNLGDGGRVRAIRSLEGDLEWKAEERELEAAYPQRPAFLRLSGSGFTYSKPYALELTLAGNDGQDRRFRISGRNLHYVVESLD